MRTITIGSNRIYGLSEELKRQIEETITVFNLAVYSSYNLHHLKETNSEEFRSIYGTKSLHMILKDKYGLDDYYTNSATQLAKGKLSSQKQLQKEYIKDKEASLKAVKDKLVKYKRDLVNYIKLRNSLHVYQDNIQKDPQAKLKVKGIRNVSVCGYEIVVRHMKDKRLITDLYGLYSFEYQYLNPKINHIKAVIGNLSFHQNRLQQEIENLKTIKKIIFGSKKIMRHHRPGDNTLAEKKYSSFQISGRKDAKYGNFVFKLKDTGTAACGSQEYKLELTLLHKKRITLDSIHFPYMGNELAKVLHEKTPICFTLKRKTDPHGLEYYQIFVSFDISVTKDINFDLSIGVFGMDFNYGHLDISETDAKGNLIRLITIPYAVTDNAARNEASLRRALDKVGKLVSAFHKCLCIEGLDTRGSKRKSTYRDPVTNRIFHIFPYERCLDFADWLGYKYGFEVIKVHPAYTSIIGKLKYGIPKKINIHQAASYVIARRGMGFKEKILDKYKPIIEDIKDKHYWSKWNRINKQLQLVNV